MLPYGRPKSSTIEISFEVETSTTILLYLQTGEMLPNRLQAARALAADVESSAKQQRNVSRWETWQTCSKMKGKRNLVTSREGLYVPLSYSQVLYLERPIELWYFHVEEKFTFLSLYNAEQEQWCRSTTVHSNLLLLYIQICYSTSIASAV